MEDNKQMPIITACSILLTTAGMLYAVTQWVLSMQYPDAPHFFLGMELKPFEFFVLALLFCIATDVCKRTPHDPNR